MKGVCNGCHKERDDCETSLPHAGCFLCAGCREKLPPAYWATRKSEPAVVCIECSRPYREGNRQGVMVRGDCSQCSLS